MGVQLSLVDFSGIPITELRPDPANQYIVVIARPDPSSTSDDPAHIAYFRKHLLGVVVHGFTPDLTGLTPDWEVTMGSALYADVYENVIEYNWVLSSFLPESGRAVAAGDDLEARVVAEADMLAAGHPGDVVDVHFIGHSRGAVVVSQALQDMVGITDIALMGSYLKVTLLDPHPAGPQNDTLLDLQADDERAIAALALTTTLQDAAQDPEIVIPSNVMDAELFYQHTPVSEALFGTGESYFNLWGESADRITNYSGHDLHVMDLTNASIQSGSLVGHQEVHDWYLENVVLLDRTFSYF